MESSNLLRIRNRTAPDHVFSDKFSLSLEFTPKNFFLYFDSATERMHNELWGVYKKNIGDRGRALSKLTHVPSGNQEQTFVTILSIKHIVYDKLLVELMNNEKMPSYFDNQTKMIQMVGRNQKRFKVSENLKDYEENGIKALEGLPIGKIFELCENQFFREIVAVFFNGQPLALVPSVKKEASTKDRSSSAKNELAMQESKIDSLVRNIEELTNFSTCSGE